MFCALGSDFLPEAICLPMLPIEKGPKMKKDLLKIFTIFFLMVNVTSAAAYSYSTLNFPGANNTIATGIDGETIVGKYTVVTKDYGFTYDGTNWLSYNYPGADGTLLYGIDNNQVVGTFFKAGIWYGVVHDGVDWTILNPPFPDVKDVFAYDIDDGMIVGGYVNSNGEWHGYLYDGTEWTSFDYPTATNFTIAGGIDGNVIVGTYETANSRHGFIFDGINWISLDHPSALSTSFRGIDGNNIVGSYYGSDSEYHAFLYDGTDWYDINQPGAISTSSADGVDGEYIVGRSSFLDGSRGFIASSDSSQVPEPKTMLLLASGLICIAGARRKIKM